MTWTPQKSRGQETSKIRQRVQEWTFGKGLDVGCGLDKIALDAIGIDLAPLPGVDYTLDARDLFLFDRDYFDYVYSAHVLEDIPDPEDALREWLRVLRPGGHLILYLPHKDFYPNIGKPGANPNHKHDFLPQDIIKILDRICSYDLPVLEERHEGDEYSFLIVARIKGNR